MQFNFVVVNYNGSELTIDLLQSIKALDREADDIVRVVIVDNDSLPTDRLRLEEFVRGDDMVTLFGLEKNIGYFGGLNAGLDVLSNKECSYTIIGNNDLKFSQNFLSELKKCRPDQRIMVLAPDVITLDGRHQNPLARKKLPAWHKVRSDIYFRNYYFTQSIRVAMQFLQGVKFLARRLVPIKHAISSVETAAEVIKLGIGACYILMPSYFERIERLDDRVFLWGEEVLLAHQVESAGGLIMYCPSLKVTHCESASVRSIETRARFEIVKASYKVYREYL